MALDFGTTAGNVLRYLKGDNLISDIDAGFQTLAEDVATKMLGYAQDSFAKKPAAGVANRLFKATDTGQLLHDTGATFESIFGPGMQTSYTTETVPGFGPEKVYSATRWSFVVVNFSKPTGSVANAGNISIGGVIVANLAMPLTSEGNVVFQTCSFFLPPGKEWVLNTGNLAAMRPLTAAYVLL